MFSTMHLQCFARRERGLAPSGSRICGWLITALWLAVTGFAALTGSPSARAEEAAAPPGKLIKFVILSRHGVRAPIPSQEELASWTSSPWPNWERPPGCNLNDCEAGWLTERGLALATHMGTYYKKYLSALLPGDECPADTELYFWADTDQRTRWTAGGLLSGFRPNCGDVGKYRHVAATKTDRIFHPVATDGRCRLEPNRARNEMNRRAGGTELPKLVEKLQTELKNAQNVLRCCENGLCQKVNGEMCPPPRPVNACMLDKNLPSCLVDNGKQGPPKVPPTQVHTGGALRVASTFAEILLLEYANGFKDKDLAFGRIKEDRVKDDMVPLFRLHTTVFDLEQRTEYVAKLQGSLLLRKIWLALNDKTDAEPGRPPVPDGTPPPGAKFVAYVGHDTNIANIGGMLDLHWHQQREGYQPDQTPPAGALTFELREDGGGKRNVYLAYVAQSLWDMRSGGETATRATRTDVRVKGCSKDEPHFPCPLDAFNELVKPQLDPDCSQ
jgi:4-phytase / acid phosphatase